MQTLKTNIEGLLIIQNEIFYDERGSFLRTFHSESFKQLRLEANVQECFYSRSKKNVIRGMHYQIPPFDNHKIIYTIEGEIKAVVLDLRKNSTTYGETFSCLLNSNEGKAIYIPTGLAQGFASLEENTIVMYITSKVFSRYHERGIKWNSFGFDWQIDKPIISGRDANFKEYSELETPF